MDASAAAAATASPNYMIGFFNKRIFPGRLANNFNFRDP